MPPSPSATALAGGYRRRDIQGLRGIAVALVVVYHAGLHVPAGFLGVDVFFVVSGFVITELILRERATERGFSFGAFYARRARRLLPALSVVVGCVAVAALLLQPPGTAQSITGATGIAAALSIANLQIYRTTGGYFDAPAATNPLLHTWSLSVEEQFYAIFPLLVVAFFAVAARRRIRRPRWFVAGCLGVLAAASLALAIMLLGAAPFPHVTIPATLRSTARRPARGSSSQVRSSPSLVRG